MKPEFYFSEEFISIEFEASQGWIYADWKGYQTEYSVKTGCEKMLEALIHYRCSYILNDNTHVVGIWTPAAKWVGENWFPRMLAHGMERFAWVYSPSLLSQVSTEEAIKHTVSPREIKTFYNIDLAKAWLRS